MSGRSVRQTLSGLALAGLIPVTLMGAVAPAQAVTVNPTWGTVSDLGGSYFDSVPFLSADGTDAVVISSSGNDLGAAYSANGGAWTGPTAIGSTHEPSYWSANVSSNVQTVVVAYMDYDDTYGTYALVSKDGGATWGSEVTLSTQAACDADDLEPVVAVSPTGEAIAVFYHYDDCNYDSVVRVSTDGGQTWGAEEVLPQQSLVEDAQLAIQDDGRAVAVWRDNTAADAFVSTRSTAGVWSAVTSIDDPTSMGDTGKVWMDVSSDGSTIVTGWTDDSSLAYVRSGTWSANSITWAPAVEIVGTTSGMTGLYHLGIDGLQTSIKGETVALLVWIQAVIFGPLVEYLAVSRDGGATFTLSPQLDSDMYVPSMTVSDSGDVIHAKWGCTCWRTPSSNPKSYTMTSVDAGQTWSTKEQISTSAGRSPAIAANSSGSKVLGVWFDDVSPFHTRAALATVAVSAPPGEPADVSAVNVGGTVTVTWSAPSSAGAGTINNYYIVVVGGGSCTVNASTFICTVTSLNVNITYTVIIYVQSQYGWSAPKVLKTVKPTLPGKPRTPAGVAGSGKVAVSWTAPTSNGGSPITSYLVTSTPGSKTCTATAPALTCEVRNLTNGTGYTFAIVARNIVGPGAAAVTSTVTPVAAVTPAPPSEPRDLAGEGADRSIVVSWKKPTSSGTQPITEYKVVAKPGGASCTVVPNSSDRTFTCTITGLVNGSDYTLTATAKNSVGLSPKATAGPATPATVPSKVRDLVIDSVTTKGVSLSWKAPLDNGGAKVTGYRVRYQPESATSDIFTFYADVTTTSVVVKGLTKGRWFFSVRAINVAGTGAFVVTTKAAKVL